MIFDTYIFVPMLFCIVLKPNLIGLDGIHSSVPMLFYIVPKHLGMIDYKPFCSVPMLFYIGQNLKLNIYPN